MIDIRTEKINVDFGSNPPHDYHCSCEFCLKYKGVLIREDKSKYSKLDRKKYYSKEDSGHIAKTPLHMARWCIQEFTKPHDWVFDPTMGAGTTAVEAVNHGRNIMGIELEFYDIVIKNIQHQFKDKHNHMQVLSSYKIFDGDARHIDKFIPRDMMFDLIINNPPYSGDEQQVGNIKTGKTKSLKYASNKPNLAFLKEGKEYYDMIEQIYKSCISHLNSEGHFCIGVKDMIRNKEPYLLHRYLGRILQKYLKYCGMVLLPHYPPTLFMSTYNKRFPDVQVPKYQTILIFRKENTL